MNNDITLLKQQIEEDYNDRMKNSLPEHWNHYTNKPKRNRKKQKIAKASRKKNRS